MNREISVLCYDLDVVAQLQVIENRYIQNATALQLKNGNGGPPRGAFCRTLRGYLIHYCSAAGYVRR